MGHDRLHAPALTFILMAVALAMPVGIWAADDAKSKPKEKEKEKTKGDDGIIWTPLLEIVARAPATAAGTYQATKNVKIDEKVVRFTAKLESATGQGGNMVLTLYKQGKPIKKIPVMKHSREGEKEVTLAVEPGEYKLEVSVNNVSATVSVATGKKK